MMRWMLDTDICIELIRGKSARILDHLRSKPVGSVGLSAITLAELRFGVANSSSPLRNQMALAQFTAPLQVAAFDGAAAGTYGLLRATLERQGRPIGPLDTLIAAHALCLRTTLVSNNTREFSRIDGLTVENWAREA